MMLPNHDHPTMGSSRAAWPGILATQARAITAGLRLGRNLTADVHRSTRQKVPRWKQVARIIRRLLLVMLLACVALAGAALFHYERIVGAQAGRAADQGPTRRTWALGQSLHRHGWLSVGLRPQLSRERWFPSGWSAWARRPRPMLFRKRALNTSGYYYGDDQVLGFSHTRLNGTGATDGGHFLVVPAIEPMDLQSLAAGPSHDLFAQRGNRLARLLRGPAPEARGAGRTHGHSARGRSSLHVQPDQPPHLLLDVINALGGRRSREGKVRVLPEANEVEGAVRTFGTFAGRYGGIKVYFVARFNQPFAAFATWQGELLSRSQTDRRGRSRRRGPEFRIRQPASGGHAQPGDFLRQHRERAGQPASGSWHPGLSMRFWPRRSRPGRRSCR